jgi:hypothetical protein
VVYFAAMVTYIFLKLAKIVVLRQKYLSVSVYIKFWLFLAGIYYFFMFVWFCYGTHVMYQVIGDCHLSTDQNNDRIGATNSSDSRTLKMVMLGILIVYWALVLLTV